MGQRTLQLHFIEGRAIGAYLYLPVEKRKPIVKSEERDHGLVVDFGEDGGPVGIEIFSFGRDVANRLNKVLKDLNIEPLSAEEQRPLGVA